MNTVRLLFLTLFTFALAFKFEYNGVCYNGICNGKNGQCGTYDTTKYNYYDCKGDLYCQGASGNSSGTCQSISTAGLNSACSSSVFCVDPDYDVECSPSDSSTCKYLPGIGPSESAGTCANYIGGNPCASGVYTFNNNTSPGCSSCGATLATSGQNCSEAPPNAVFCAQGLYCNAYSGTCASRITAGNSCNSTSQCAWNLICSTQSQSGGSFKCVAPFSQAVGSSCTSLYDCVANSICSSGTCTKVSNGAACTLSSTSVQSSCATGYECVCNGGAGSSKGKCEAVSLSQSEINDVTSYLSCMGSHCLYDLGDAFSYVHSTLTVAYTPDSCAAKSCSSQVNNLENTITGSIGGCSSAVSLVVSAALALFATVLVVL